jgi:hypothetical protein
MASSAAKPSHFARLALKPAQNLDADQCPLPRRLCPCHLSSPTEETLMITDDQLQKDALAELAWEPTVEAAHIGVAARDGIVTLSGHVPS